MLKFINRFALYENKIIFLFFRTQRKNFQNIIANDTFKEFGDEFLIIRNNIWMQMWKMKYAICHYFIYWCKRVIFFGNYKSYRYLFINKHYLNNFLNIIKKNHFYYMFGLYPTIEILSTTTTYVFINFEKNCRCIDCVDCTFFQRYTMLLETHLNKKLNYDFTIFDIFIT